MEEVICTNCIKLQKCIEELERRLTQYKNTIPLLVRRDYEKTISKEDKSLLSSFPRKDEKE